MENKLRCAKCGRELTERSAFGLIGGMVCCVGCAAVIRHYARMGHRMEDVLPVCRNEGIDYEPGYLQGAGCTTSKTRTMSFRDMDELKRVVCIGGKPVKAVPAVDRVIRNGRATIILWADGQKTVARCKEGEPQDDYAGFCACVVKRMYGSSRKAKRLMDEKGAPKDGKGEAAPRPKQASKPV